MISERKEALELFVHFVFPLESDHSSTTRRKKKDEQSI